MRFEGRDQLILADLAAVEPQVDEPCLVVDTRADVIEFGGGFRAEDFGDLFRAMLHAMAEADRIHLAIFDGRPGIHGHGVGIVQEFCAGCRDFANILAEIQNDRNVALAIKNAAGADGVTDALVDPVFQRDTDVVRIGFQTADPHTAYDVFRTLKRATAVGMRRHFHRKTVGLHDLVEDRPDHIQIVLADIRQRDFDVAKLRHAQEIGEQFFRETDAACANNSDFETHNATSVANRTGETGRRIMKWRCRKIPVRIPENRPSSQIFQQQYPAGCLLGSGLCV
ncbi:hypothetical protein D3C71_503450 [compost metagenome]